MMRKSKYLFLVIALLLLVSGCKKNDPEIVNMSGTDEEFNEDAAYNININGSGRLQCIRDVNISQLEDDFRYSITYKDGAITMLHSQEKVTGTNQTLLNEYEEAYKNIKNQYKGLRYYDVTVTRNDNSVIYDTVINYEKIDMDKLREIEPEIEGQSDIYKNNKLMLKTWWEFSKDMGMTCKGV